MYSASTRTRTLFTLAWIKQGHNNLSAKDEEKRSVMWLVHFSVCTCTSATALNLIRARRNWTHSLSSKPGKLIGWGTKKLFKLFFFFSSEAKEKVYTGQLMGHTSPSMALTTRFKSYGCFEMRFVNFTLKRAAHTYQFEIKHVSTTNSDAEISCIILINHVQKDLRIFGRLFGTFICLTHNSGLISAVAFSWIMGSLLQVLLWEICAHSNMASKLSSYLFSLEVTNANTFRE